MGQGVDSGQYGQAVGVRAVFLCPAVQDRAGGWAAFRQIGEKKKDGEKGSDVFPFPPF